MSSKRIVVRNVFWNWVGQAAGIIIGFLVPPFLVHRLGETTYGLWILVASLTGYFGLLDFGLRGAVGRHVAFHRARGDQTGVNSTLSTSLAILCGVACVALAATFAFLPFFVRVFDIPSGETDAARLALLLVGANLALLLPSSVFDATLWGTQRFDLINAIDIGSSIMRMSLTFYFVGRGYGLVALGWITIATTLVAVAVKAGASFSVDRSIRLSARYIRWSSARELYGYGLWSFVISVSRMFTSQFSSVLVGAQMSVSAVTPYSIASRLIGYGSSVVSSGAGVMTPLAASYHAGEDDHGQRSLFIEGNKFCLALSLFFLAPFLLLSRAFFTLWMGPEYAGVSHLVTILALGEVLPMAQLVSGSVLLGMGRPKTLAITSVLEGAAVIGLLAALGGRHGLVGICLAFAIPAAVFRGLAVLVTASWAVGVPVWLYLPRVFLPVVAAALAPAAVLTAATWWSAPTTWLSMVLYMTAYGLCFLAACTPLVGADRLRAATAGRLGNLSAARR